MFVDMDETLLHYDLFDGTTELRAGACEALKHLRRHADVYVLSAGYPTYVMDRLTEMRLFGYIDGAFSTFTYPTGNWVGNRRWVLLDNDPFLAEMKCELIEPGGPSRWIEVASFDNDDVTVPPLTTYVGAALRALGVAL